MDVTNHSNGVFTIDDFLSPTECSEHIARSEGIGFSEATIRAMGGKRLFKQVRNNDRVVCDDIGLAANLYRRAKALLPSSLDGWSLWGFNERLRYYKYGQRQQFLWHVDGRVCLDWNHQSFLTFLIYLNADFEGGSTDFEWGSITPSRGMALVFPHALRHQGASITSGTKFVLRTDVLYEAESA